MTIKRIVFENQIREKKFFSLLSLCKRSGQLVSGEARSENAIRTGEAGVVFISREASENTKKKFANKSEYYNVPIFALDFSKERMGKTIGEAQRSVIVITGGDFTEQLTGFYSRTEDKA